MFISQVVPLLLVSLFTILAVTPAYATVSTSTNPSVAADKASVADLPATYQLSKGEVIAFTAQGSHNRPHKDHHQENQAMLAKRGLHSALECFNKDSFRTNPDSPAYGQIYEEFRWLGASCDTAYKSQKFRVWCSVQRRRLNGSWSFNRITQFIAYCPDRTYCANVNSDYNGLGMRVGTNDVDCRLIDEAWDSIDRDVIALELYKWRGLMSCTKHLPVPQHPTPQSNYQGDSSKKRKRVWSLQMEVSLANGGDYHPAELFIKDVTFSQPKILAPRFLANVTNIEIETFPLFGVARRVFQFCVNVGSVAYKNRNDWLLVHYSAMDITNRRRGRIGYDHEVFKQQMNHSNEFTEAETMDGGTLQEGRGKMKSRI